METNKSVVGFPCEVGPEQTQLVRLADFNIVTQTRREYAQDGIDELAHSMLVYDQTGETVVGLKLVNPPIVGRFTASNAETYLHDLNSLFDTEHTIDDLHPAEDGTYFILIAGHRRSLSLRQAVGACGGTDESVLVRTVVLNNITFDQAFREQTIENIHDRPAVQDEAEAIAKYYLYRQKKMPEATSVSVAQCARELSLRETKVRNALKYAELPTHVKQFITDKLLTYTDGVLINDVQRAYREREAQKPGATIVEVEDVTDYLTETFAIRVINRRSRKDVGERFGAKEFIGMIKGEIDTVRQYMSHQGGFDFELEFQDGTPRAARALAVTRLAETASRLAGIVAENNPELAQSLFEQLLAKLPEQDTHALVAQQRIF